MGPRDDMPALAALTADEQPGFLRALTEDAFLTLVAWVGDKCELGERGAFTATWPEAKLIAFYDVLMEECARRNPAAHFFASAQLAAEEAIERGRRN